MLKRLPDHDTLYAHLVRRDPSLDGVVYVGVRTTGVFCRPVCPARTPLSKNITFYPSAEAALAAGLRACRRCRPLSPPDAPGEVVNRLVQLIESDVCRRWTEADLRDLGIEPATARRQFRQRFGMSFSRYARARRLGEALNTIHRGEAVIEAQLDAGFDSASGFRAAFARSFGQAPSQSRAASALAMGWIDTPLGLMLAIADTKKLHMLEFIARRELEAHVDRYRRQFNASVLPGETPALNQIRQEVADYFSGRSLIFRSCIAGAGTAFQNEVWDELRRIPPGETRSYADIAQRVGRPRAVRAVANANRLNRCAIILPCHRVIGANGALTGYAGGLWRKQWLLDHERRLLKRGEPAGSS